MNAWAVPTAGIKSGDQTTTNNTFINDADMRFAMAASAIYEFHCYVRYSSGTGQDFKVSFSVPAGAKCRYHCARGLLTTEAYAGDGDFDDTSVTTAFGAGTGSANARTMMLFGVAFTAGTAGNLIFQWAQNTTGAFNTTLYQYSYVTGARIG